MRLPFTLILLLRSPLALEVVLILFALFSSESIGGPFVPYYLYRGAKGYVQGGYR